MKESIPYKDITKAEIINYYMNNSTIKEAKGQSIERSTALRHYERVKVLIDPVVEYVNIEKLANEREGTLDLSNSILKLSSNKYISIFLKLRDKIITEMVDKYIASNKSTSRMNKDFDFPKFNPLEPNGLNELYDGLLNAAEFLNDKLKSEFINYIDEQFQKYGQTAFIRPYYKCCNEYRNFFDSITNRERLLMIKRMKRYYNIWLKSVKIEYDIED